MGPRKDPSIPNQPARNPPQTEPKDSPTSGGRTLGLGGLLIELVLPVALSAAFLLVMASYTRYWDLRTPVGLGVFGVLLVVVSLILSIRVDGFTLKRREKRGRQQLLNRVDSRSRLVKFALGGVVIPIAVFAAANLLELPNDQTPMSLAIQFRLVRPEVDRAQQLGNAVLRAEGPAAKVQGILALQALGSGEALDQLVRLLSDDPTVLKGGSEYQALAKALASYGVQAKAKLLRRLEQVSPGARRAAPSPGDLFERYFAVDFTEMRSEIEQRRADSAARAAELERIQAAQTELRQALARFQTATDPAESSVPALIMQAFLQMGLKQDAELLAFARQTAADTSWSDAVRGQALLLVAKLGSKDDLDGLYGYLETPNAPLQARALEAIATLLSRLSVAGTSGQSN